VWDYSVTQKKYWNDITRQRAFFDQLAIKLNIQTPEDWYNVNVRTVEAEGGSFISKYKGSLLRGIYFLTKDSQVVQALKSVYPEYKWKEAKTVMPRGHWHDLNNQRTFFDQVANKLNITSPQGWENVTVKQVEKLGGTFVKHYYNGSLGKGKHWHICI
jgi:hypothetical protein